VKVWILYDYGVGHSRRISYRELSHKEIVTMINEYRSPSDNPTIRFFLHEEDAKHALAMLEVEG